jgi:hypothetical protein
MYIFDLLVRTAYWRPQTMDNNNKKTAAEEVTSAADQSSTDGGIPIAKCTKKRNVKRV